MKKFVISLLLICLVFSLVACSGKSADTLNDNETVAEETETLDSSDASENPIEETEDSEEHEKDTALSQEAETENISMKLKINDTQVEIAWEDNESVDALMKLCSDTSLEIQMSMYGGFEQVGSIGETLPRDDEQTTTNPGDIVLYSGNQIVVFYGSNSWAYTRLGRIVNLSDDKLTNLLSNGDVMITISVD